MARRIMKLLRRPRLQARTFDAARVTFRRSPLVEKSHNIAAAKRAKLIVSALLADFAAVPDRTENIVAVGVHANVTEQIVKQGRSTQIGMHTDQRGLTAMRTGVIQFLMISIDS